MKEDPPQAGAPGHVRALAGHSVVYGLADVLPQAVNLALFPLFAHYLGAEGYGTLALLAFLAAPLKILFRAADAGFFRIHYELEEDGQRRILAGTVVLFSGALGALLLLGGGLGSGLIADLLSSREPLPRGLVILVFADLFVGNFAAVPQALLRIEGRSRAFTGLALARHTVGIGLKVLLLMRGAGVEGVLWSDLAATTAYVVAQAPFLARRAVFAPSLPLLRRVLGFGVPKVPHGILVQAQNLADRRILEAFVSRADLGVYNVGYTLAGAVKFPISAFEQAWQPFVYSQVGRPEAAATLARVGTFFFAAFTAAALGVALFAPEVIGLLRPEFQPAAAVVPIVVLAYLLHGFFLLTSIGIGIEKKARYYPLITLAAAAANIGLNLVFIPRWGLLGAAWVTVISYLLMAALGFRISQRLFRLPIEWPRYARLGASAAAVFAVAVFVPPAPPLSLAAKGILLLSFPFLLWSLGFWASGETVQIWRLLRPPKGQPAAD